MGNKPTKQKDKVALQVPWKWWIGLLFIIGIYYASQFIAGSLLYIYGASQGWSSGQLNDWLGGSLYAQFFFILLTESLVVGGIYFFIRQYRVGMKSIGLRKPKWTDLVYAIMVVPAYFIIYLVAVLVVSKLVSGFDINQQQEIGFHDVRGNLEMLAAFFSLVILTPIAEEIMVRGVLYSSLKKAMPVLWATLATSALFAIPHLLEGGSSGLLYIAGLDTFILSLFLIYLREKTGGLWASIVLHAIKNGIAFTALFVLHMR